MMVSVFAEMSLTDCHKKVPLSILVCVCVCLDAWQP